MWLTKHLTVATDLLYYEKNTMEINGYRRFKIPFKILILKNNSKCQALLTFSHINVNI